MVIHDGPRSSRYGTGLAGRCGTWERVHGGMAFSTERDAVTCKRCRIYYAQQEESETMRTDRDELFLDTMPLVHKKIASAGRALRCLSEDTAGRHDPHAMTAGQWQSVERQAQHAIDQLASLLGVAVRMKVVQAARESAAMVGGDQ